MGWISEGAQLRLRAADSSAYADAYGVGPSTLCSPPCRAPPVLHVCDDIACRCKGRPSCARSWSGRSGPRTTMPEGDHP